ncbi:ATP-binding cassette domain-containing protein [Arthrobacter sp. SD76]|uniref:ATP-binding cassette domain-containing protein n=1 Tax=Arthrobacter sp. SD76 TaxID=3415007 RepID=UPI003C75D9C0
MTSDSPVVALSVRHVAKAYGGALALEDVSLTVRAGEVHALLGQNGCGKSTLIKILTGVVTADAGEVEIFGSPLNTTHIDSHDSHIAVVHQDIGVVDSMTVLENLGVTPATERNPCSPWTSVRSGGCMKKSLAGWASHSISMHSSPHSVPLNARCSPLHVPCAC